VSEQAWRFPDDEDGIANGAEGTGRVCYWRWKGRWWVWLPGGFLADLSKHDVTENTDGTITVAPSVLVSGPRQRNGALVDGVWQEQWPGGQRERHGFFERGEWRDV